MRREGIRANRVWKNISCYFIYIRWSTINIDFVWHTTRTLKRRIYEVHVLGFAAYRIRPTHIMGINSKYGMLLQRGQQEISLIYTDDVPRETFFLWWYTLYRCRKLKNTYRYGKRTRLNGTGIVRSDNV